jgi:hypothetical protein
MYINTPNLENTIFKVHSSLSIILFVSILTKRETIIDHNRR